VLLGDVFRVQGRFPKKGNLGVSNEKIAGKSEKK
jgi:hypothetical protein